MTSLAVSAANVGAETSAVNQELSPAEQEQFMLPTDVYDASINAQPLEVYMYWSAIEREREANDTRPVPDSPWTIFYKKVTGQSGKINHAGDDIVPHNLSENATSQQDEYSIEKSEKGGDEREVQVSPSSVTDYEKQRAYRVLRVASWQAIFYLITTDILGFSTAQEAFAELGYGPGVLVYAFFYLLAVFAGQVIWYLYLHLDSSKYPVKCYADLGERTFGRKVRHIFNFFQSFQLLFNVALLIIGGGQTLVVMIEWKFCYLALNIFFTLAGMLGGQIRSLRNFAWFANVSVWLNIMVMIMTIVGIWKYPPVPSVSNHADLSEPVMTSGWVPGYTVGWYQQVSGVQLAIFAYGGAMIFPEFMAEMRRPRDFWKGALCAQLFCFLIYMIFGIVNYTRQGQYSSILPGIDFANQALSLATNSILIASTFVACVLYGNIGVKVFYENVLRAYFKAPSLLSNKGRLIWAVTVCCYWIIAWVIGSAIPNITALVTLVGAACILQFTYTFPPILLLGHWMQMDAMKADNPWTPGVEPGSNRIDTWKDKSRWIRGFKRYWYVKVFLFLMFLGAWANCALGLYAGVETAKQSYAGAYNVPFSCIAPSDPSVQPASSG